MDSGRLWYIVRYVKLMFINVVGLALYGRPTDVRRREISVRSKSRQGMNRPTVVAPLLIFAVGQALFQLLTRFSGRKLDYETSTGPESNQV